MAEGLHEGGAHGRHVLPDGCDIKRGRSPPVPVIGMSDLVDVGAELAEPAKEPCQLPALDRRTPDRPNSGVAERHPTQERTDAVTRLGGCVIDAGVLFRGAAHADEPAAWIAHAAATSPRCGAPGLAGRYLVHDRASLTRLARAAP